MKNTAGTFGYPGLFGVSILLGLFCVQELLITIGSNISADYPWFYPVVVLLLILSVSGAFFSYKRIAS